MYIHVCMYILNITKQRASYYRLEREELRGVDGTTTISKSFVLTSSLLFVVLLL